MTDEQLALIKKMQRDLMGGLSHEDYWQAMNARMAANGFWFHPDDRDELAA